MLPKDDHRRIGQELDLFHLQDEAPGAVFWHPRGLVVVRQLEEHVRRAIRADGYLEVRSPQVLKQPIWEASGHWEAFGGGMIRVEDDEDPERASALKPVSCPAHLQIARRRAPSWRDLPLRIAELGVVHRNEPSGSLHGLFRLRQFMQDDGHVLCAEDQVEGEVRRFLERARALYASFGFSVSEIALSSRPEARFGDDALWDRAEGALARAANAAGFACKLQPGQGAFYGPKLEIALPDRAGRPWQCGTVQLDYVLPERFGARYVDKDGARRSLVMLHRAMLGSFERFFAIVLERSKGALPPWLAPVSVRILPVSSAYAAYAEEVASALRERSIRAEVDAAEGSLPRRIALAHAERIPIVGVVGKREEASRSVVLREGNGRSMALDDAAREIASRVAPPPVPPPVS